MNMILKQEEDFLLVDANMIGVILTIGADFFNYKLNFN